MMNHYENVYGDVSEMLIVSGAGGATKIRDILEMAPTKKLMYQNGTCRENPAPNMPPFGGRKENG